MFKRIAIAYDGSDGSKMAFDKALELKQDFPETELTIIYVNEETQESTSFMAPGDTPSSIIIPDVDGTNAPFTPGAVDEGRTSSDTLERQSEFSKHMHNSIQQQLDEKNVEANVLALEGNASKTIPAFIEEQKIELLVVGNSGKSGLQKFFIGSVSKKLLKDSPCSVLVIK
ncbi:universal stress protein [Metaplanococcus flavidus]|uniref:Universal stress protein n=1 Tax=Metaplanococcus flavidus TaxID=569883 RepID=A0ABW3L5I0_9BACL